MHVKKQSYASDNATKKTLVLFMLFNVLMLQHRRNTFYWVVLRRTSCLFPVTFIPAHNGFHLSVRKIMRFSVRICCLSRIRSEDSKIRCTRFCPAFCFFPVDYALLIGLWTQQSRDEGSGELAGQAYGAKPARSTRMIFFAISGNSLERYGSHVPF